jgi:UDP-glucose 4-epimerase
VLEALAGERAGREVTGLARRRPGGAFPWVDWRTVDITRDDLVGVFRGADVVVHLAWLIQPSRDQQTLRRVNVTGSERVFRAAVEAKVRSLVYASSVGAYSPGPKDRAVDESWPTGGIATSFYSRHKAETERMLDRLEREQPALRVVRLRPGLIFKREAGPEIRRLFAGPFLPGALVRRELIPVVPRLERLRFQAVHSLDVGEAYRLAIAGDVRGAFNIAAEPVLDSARLAGLLGARLVPLPAPALRAAASITWRLRLQPTPPGWLDMALGIPLMDITRARRELGWEPARSSEQALLDLLEGIREAAGVDTPPLASDTGGASRVREIFTGVGARGG